MKYSLIDSKNQELRMHYFQMKTLLLKINQMLDALIGFKIGDY